MKKKQRKRIEAIVGLWHTSHLNISHQVIEEKFGSLEDRANRTSEHLSGRISALRADFNVVHQHNEQLLASQERAEADLRIFEKKHATEHDLWVDSYKEAHAETHHDLVTQVTALEMRVRRLVEAFEAHIGPLTPYHEPGGHLAAAARGMGATPVEDHSVEDAEEDWKREQAVEPGAPESNWPPFDHARTAAHEAAYEDFSGRFHADKGETR